MPKNPAKVHKLWSRAQFYVENIPLLSIQTWNKATVTKEKLTFQEAEGKVKDTSRENQKQYIFIVKLNPPRENNQTEQ